MIIFDTKGQENFNNQALKNPATSETDKLGTLKENVSLSWDVAKYQELGISESLNFRTKIEDQFKTLYKLTGDEQYNTRFLSKQIVGAKKGFGTKTGPLGGSDTDFDANRNFLETQSDLIINLRKENPDAGLLTMDEMQESRNKELEQDRIDLVALQDRSQTLDVSVGNVASMGAYFMDPELLATIPFSGGSSVGGRVAQNAWRSFKIESGLAAVSETAIAPKVYDFKHQIGQEEYDLKDAAIRIVSATLGAGIIRSAGSVTIDLSKIGLAKTKLLKAGKADEAAVLDDYVKMMQDAPLVKDVTGDAHIIAQAKVAQALERGEIITQKELDDILGDISTEKIDPNEIQVDAKTFQYKDKTDAQGVSEALKGVKKWEAIKADSILVWEKADGTRFVADGHQRLGLAKRLIGEGTDPKKIGLNAFVLREADGFSAAFAREYAALRNIASGTGTAMDAAKVLKASGRGLGNLPPESALARDALGLSQLDDEAFRMIIDDVISHKYGAIVGDLIKDGAEQAATIRALRQLKPANETQARLMVQDMRAAGFQKTETQDLFGGFEVTESLFKERAKAIDSTMKKLKKDKAVFKTLADQESKITGAGNILDREANISRLTDDEKTLATLTALANSKGPISDAINKAAKRIKDGESVAKATEDLIPEVKKAVESGDLDMTPKEPVGKTVQQQIDELPEGVEPLAVVPPDAPGVSIGTFTKTIDGVTKTYTKVDIDRSKIDIDCDNFCYPDLKPSKNVPKDLLKNTRNKYKLKNGKGGPDNETVVYKPARAKKHQEYINKELANGSVAADGEKPIVWLMGGGGASGKGSVLEKLREDGVISEKGFVHIDPDEVKFNIDEYKTLSEEYKDYRAAAVVHEESSDIAKSLQTQATDQKLNMIIDKTLGKEQKALKLIDELKVAGYDVRLIGVTIDPSEALVRALTRYYSSGRLVPPKMIIKAHKGFNAAFPEYAKSVDRSMLFDNTTVSKEIASSSDGKLDVISKEEYNNVQSRGNLDEATTTHKQLRESQNLQGQLDGQSSPVARRDTRGVAEDSRLADGERDGQAQPEVTPTKDLGFEDPTLNDLFNDKIKQADDLLAERGDFDVVSGIKDSGRGEVELEYKTVRESFEEIDAEQKTVDDLFKCVGGS